MYCLTENTCRALQITSTAHHILIVEKESVFRALCEARIWDLMPVVLVTGQGMPDIATRAMVTQIVNASVPSSKLHFRGESPQPSAKCVMGLVDWNPSGCYILSNYKFGNKKASKQSTTCEAVFGCMHAVWLWLERITYQQNM